MGDKLITKEFEIPGGILGIFATTGEIVVESTRAENKTRRALIISKADPAGPQDARDVVLQLGTPETGITTIPVPDEVFKRALHIVLNQIINRVI